MRCWIIYFFCSYPTEHGARLVCGVCQLAVRDDISRRLPEVGESAGQRGHLELDGREILELQDFGHHAESLLKPRLLGALNAQKHFFFLPSRLS